MKATRRLSDIGVDIIEESITEDGLIDIDALNGLQMEFHDKVGRCIAFMKRRKYQEDLCDAEVKRLRAEIKAVEADKKSFQRERIGIGGYVMVWMQKLGLKRVEAGIHRATVAKKPTSIEVLDESQVPPNFMKQNIRYVVDKTAIKVHFNTTGEYVDGIDVHHDETHLLVRYGKVDEKTNVESNHS